MYKRKGEDKNIVKVKNPAITPIKLNRGAQSEYFKEFMEEESEELKPLFVDYKKEIQAKVLKNGIEMSFIVNKTNDLFNLNVIFDMGNDNNPFKFDAHLSSMSATDFNSLLEALAFVSVESGTIKDLSMQAEGDMLYATGNMKFLYNDLKVSTINKKNLKTKGMGKVMKTFFANAFVVKKNNPAFKLFPRDGAMYYERDPQKIIIDYVTKTALSGVVSSIGARNARKDIKKIQKESKKQKDTERKALKKADRRTSP